MVSFALRRGAGADAEDAVQATLAEAWQQQERPTDPEQLRRWLWGILRHKVIDLHRKRSREVQTGDFDHESAKPSAAETDGADDLLRWASRTLPQGKDNQQTLEWLLREADGESLEHIAHDAALPPARVRKRVSRLREHFRAHWQRDVAALAALGIVAGVLLWLWPRPPEPTPIARDIAPDPRLELRERAHRACERSAWRECLDLLDEATRGDTASEPERAAADRRRATEQLTPPPVVSAPIPSAKPSTLRVAPSPKTTSESSTPPVPKPRSRSSIDSEGSL